MNFRHLVRPVARAVGAAIGFRARLRPARRGSDPERDEKFESGSWRAQADARTGLAGRDGPPKRIFSAPSVAGGGQLDPPRCGWCARTGTESLLTLRWRKMDSNFQYAGAVDLVVAPFVQPDCSGGVGVPQNPLRTAVTASYCVL
jgi:hypothetical protein